MKAPSASDIDTPGRLVASRAAPGVDHPVSTGMRVATDSPMPTVPMPQPRAHSQEAIWSDEAPAAFAAWNTSAAEPA
jgi:hypothetical protein